MPSGSSILDLQVGTGGTISYRKGPRTWLWEKGIQITELTRGADWLPMMAECFFQPAISRVLTAPSSFSVLATNLHVRGCVDWILDHDTKCDKGDFKGTLLTATLLKADVVSENGTKILKAQILTNQSEVSHSRAEPV